MIWASFADAGIALALLLLLAFGVDVKIILAAVLALEICSSLGKGIVMLMTPIIEALKKAKASLG